jgi:CBS domain containing-hemolysin-like protein
MTDDPKNRVEAPPPAAGEAAPAPRPPAPTAPSGEPDSKKKRGLIGRLARRLRRNRRAEELRETIEAIIESSDSEREEIAPDEKWLLRNILRLHGVTVADVMVPRAEIVAVDASTQLQTLIEFARNQGHSRFPVYRGSPDEIVGMIHVKDLLPFWSQRRNFKIEKVLRKALFTAPTMRVLDLLKEMRSTRIHLALVVDEYGGVDGLVTIEDLVEEIVGEIEDEHDSGVPPTLVEEGEGVALADARIAIGELEARCGRFVSDEERAEVDTLGGLVFYLASRVPARGEIIRHPSGVEFEIVEADPRRVRQLRIRNYKRDAPAAAAGS